MVQVLDLTRTFDPPSFSVPTKGVILFVDLAIGELDWCPE
jgi:hypothetical protein